VAAPQDFIGLYITPDRIEASLPAGPDGTVAETYSYPLPPDLINDDGAVVSVDGLADALKEAWRELGLRKKRIVLILNARQAIVRLVRLPHIPLNQLNHAILSEAEQFALFRNEIPLVDYFVTGDDGDFVWVCYAAAAESLIKPFEAALKGAGLRLVGVDLVQLAGQRGMDYFHHHENAQWIGIMLLQQRLIVSSWLQGRLTAIRELVLPERDNISMELVALNYLPDAVRSVATTGPNDDPRIVIGAERIEDARSLAHHAEAHVKLPIYVAEPDEHMDELPSCVTLGAGLWGRSDTFPSFNLVKGSLPSFSLPTLSLPALPEGSELLLPVVGAAVALVGLTVGGLFWTQRANASLQDLKNRFAEAEMQRSEIQRQIKTQPPDADLLRSWIPRQGETRFAADLVSRLRGIMPSDAWVSHISYFSGQEVRLQGAALNQTSCLYFADQLGALESVSQVRILRLEKQGNAYAFELQASMARPPAEAAKP
jgi:hypothetical protein